MFSIPQSKRFIQCFQHVAGFSANPIYNYGVDVGVGRGNPVPTGTGEWVVCVLVEGKVPRLSGTVVRAYVKKHKPIITTTNTTALMIGCLIQSSM